MNSFSPTCVIPTRDTINRMLDRLSGHGRVSVYGFSFLTREVIDYDDYIFDRLFGDDESLLVINFYNRRNDNYFFSVRFSDHKGLTTHTYKFLLSGFVDHEHARMFIDYILSDIPSCECTFLFYSADRFDFS